MTTMTADPKAKATDDEKKPGSKKKLIIVVVALLAVAGGVYNFVLRDKGPVEPQAGEVLVIEPIQLNLQGGHYLRVGLALQLTTTAEKPTDGSKALDATISLLSGRSVEELGVAKERDKLKTELEKELEEAYEGTVMGVYFTEFVTQ
ncbi:flagellar basal body-associated FliL family protein [Nocardioides rubriscoriae]|uniref:flagellar basal body-associated FliL family protein n=1 Tax=Nocardioides rubriscoriae TaxID=642762 RepID=UPI0011DF569A|nr:flagellar basal body-associated FliL family protein [Nocardioides rubriscoriae]